MTGRPLSAGKYGFDDVSVGDWVQTSVAKVTVDAIDAFAGLSGDRFEIHMNKAAAIRHGFPDRVAHGLLVLGLVDGLKNNADATFNAQASLGWEWDFRAPVIAGDTISVRITVAGKDAITDPARGILRLRFDVNNQDGAMVQEGWNRLMVYR